MTTNPAKPLRICLIRHGETAWSVTGRHTGRTDIPLSANGENEARKLGHYLRDIPFAHVLSSPLLRARQTWAWVGLPKAPELEPDLATWNAASPAAFGGKRPTEPCPATHQSLAS